MFGFSKDHKTIEVAFYERDAAEPFARSAVPIETLPDTFQIDTTLHLGDEDWTVGQADPPTKAAFRKSGRLCIRLYKPEFASVSPADLLYSLPTIGNEFPDLEATSSLENVFVAHEDDWRQIECVAADQADAVGQELAAIRALVDTQRVPSGFRAIHVRKGVPRPLAARTLHLDALARSVPVAHRYAGVAFSSGAAVVVGGFALRTADGAVLWGQADPPGQLLALCARFDTAFDAAEAPWLRSLLARHDLLLVDWPGLWTLPEPAA